MGTSGGAALGHEFGVWGFGSVRNWIRIWCERSYTFRLNRAVYDSGEIEGDSPSKARRWTERTEKGWEVKVMAPWFNQFKVSPVVEIREELFFFFFLLLLLCTRRGHVLPWPAANVISICCSFLSWLPAPLPEPRLLQSAAYLRVSLRLPGAPLWGGGSRAGVHPGRGRSEARWAGDQPFPEGPTAEKACRQGYRYQQGPDPTTYNHQAAGSPRVSAAAVLRHLFLI